MTTKTRPRTEPRRETTARLGGVRILPMAAHLEPDVRALYHDVHPEWSPLPAPHFFAYPTLIAVTDGEQAAVVGYSSYSLNTTDDGVLAIYLKDTGVAEHARGRGIARELMMARLAIGRDMGAACALGMTQPDNTAMLALLRSCGFHEGARIAGFYRQGTPSQDGIVFTRALQGD